MNTRILVFAKAPRPGHVKTRLIPALGADGAAKLAREMLARTLAAACAARCGTVELCMDPSPADPAWDDIALPAGVVLTEQGVGDLGARLARAARRVVAGGERVVLIGTDCVEMDAPLLRQAVQALATADVVIYATADGGYALLGLTRFDPSLFSAIAWSSPQVAAQTRARVATLGWTLHEGHTLHDVDTAEDLPRWHARV